MKKVLITGGTGFIGSNFVNKFLELGDEVNLIVRPESNFWRIESVKSKTKLHLVDLTNAEEIERFIGNLRPQIILHFATYGAYQGRGQDIKRTIDIAKKLKKCGVKIVVLEQSRKSINIGRLDLTGDIALVVGNEVNGVGGGIMKLCDAVVEISMHGKKESLNVAVATGIAVFELKNRLNAIRR